MATRPLAQGGLIKDFATPTKSVARLLVKSSQPSASVKGRHVNIKKSNFIVYKDLVDSLMGKHGEENHNQDKAVLESCQLLLVIRGGAQHDALSAMEP